jgi:amidase
LDPRQYFPYRPVAESTTLYRDCCQEASLSGLRIGVLREAFQIPERSEVEVDKAVRAASYALKRHGAEVREVKVPLHRKATMIWNGIGNEGAVARILHGNGVGTNHHGWYSSSLMEFLNRSRRQNGDQLPITLKLTALVGEFMNETYGGKYYAIAQGYRRQLALQYDSIFNACDIIVSPTTPMRAMRRPAGTELQEYLEPALGVSANTMAANLTGHPALSTPLTESTSLPIGLMLTARRFDERSLFRVASVLGLP